MPLPAERNTSTAQVCRSLASMKLSLGGRRVSPYASAAERSLASVDRERAPGASALPAGAHTLKASTSVMLIPSRGLRKGRCHVPTEGRSCQAMSLGLRGETSCMISALRVNTDAVEALPGAVLSEAPDPGQDRVQF